MSCENIQEKLADYVTGRLDTPEVSTVERHLGGCPSCQQLRERFELFYTLRIPESIPTAPSSDSMSVLREELSPIPTDATRPGRPLLRVAAIIILLLGGFGLAWLYRAQDRDSASPPVPLPLPRLAITLPPLPPSYPPPGWLSSREEALEVARFSGKPVLQQVYTPDCTRCQGMEEKLDEPEARAELEQFVCLRERLEDEPPPWLSQYPVEKLGMMLPAMRIVGAEEDTGPVLEIASVDQVATLIERWKSRGQDHSDKKTLDRETYDGVLAKLDSIPSLVKAGEYALAFERLEQIIQLGKWYRTAFVDSARELKERIDLELEREITKIEELACGSARERQQALDLAARFREQLRELPQEARLTALLAD